ncbi:MAG: hypothetical protein Q7V20_23040 [Aquabacterium sp.]|uniref:hypothetical protein n=1 Tax=Aquabacterium sp. TaxID=1872578 RepID=UPI0027191CD2|nr:hypothetical protein [Aquabacterium sp.]MDO9006330.1 hypothetical protein [Aquabacterium sp.]
MSDTEIMRSIPEVDSDIASVLGAVVSVFYNRSFTLTRIVSCEGQTIETRIEASAFLPSKEDAA